MKKALIIGFFGRENSGDEMMLEMHRRILKRLGFEKIDLTTELPDEVVPHYRYPIQKNILGETYDLILIGGGALSPGYGFFPASFFKFEKKAKVIFSSVNVAPHARDYLEILNRLADLIVTRSLDQYEITKKFLPKLMFLPDVSTIYRPQNRQVKKRIAVVIRNDAKTVIEFKPKDPFDVLVLSRDDLQISQRYAQKHQALLIPLFQDLPETHVEKISEYERVLSVGRFHAALYAQMLKKEFVYLFPNFPKKIPTEILHIQGEIPWEGIKEIGEYHSSLSKAGLLAAALDQYGAASEQDYLDAFASVLGADSAVKP